AVAAPAVNECERSREFDTTTGILTGFEDDRRAWHERRREEPERVRRRGLAGVGYRQRHINDVSDAQGGGGRDGVDGSRDGYTGVRRTPQPEGEHEPEGSNPANGGEMTSDSLHESLL